MLACCSLVPDVPQSGAINPTTFGTKKIQRLPTESWLTFLLLPGSQQASI